MDFPVAVQGYLATKKFLTVSQNNKKMQHGPNVG
jgi:hypothetical protein